MAYARKYRRYRRRAKRIYRKGRSTAATASKALSLAAKTYSLLNPEFKVHDVNVTSAISTTANIVSLASIAQGDGASSRDGRSIKVTSLQLCGSYALHSSATIDVIRTMVVIDKDSSGTTPTITDLLASSDPCEHRNVLSDQNRFRVLYDSLQSLNSAGKTQCLQRKYMKLNHHVKYDGTAAADYSWGNIYLVQLGRRAASTSSQNMFCRIRYLDN